MSIEREMKSAFSSGAVVALQVSSVLNHSRDSFGTTKSLHTIPGPFTSQPRSTKELLFHHVTLGRGDPKI